MNTTGTKPRRPRGVLAYTMVAAVLAAAVAGCATPDLQHEATYPASWPDIVTSAADCSVLSGTYHNKGVLIDKSGQEQDVWLTTLLPFSRRAPPVDARTERAALRECARVALGVEERPWPDSPNRKTAKLVVIPSRDAGAGPTGRSEPCTTFELPEHLGWPHNDDVFAVCYRGSYTLSMNPGQFVYPAYELRLTRAVDGSLTVKWSYGPQLNPDHVWARFTPAP